MDQNTAHPFHLSLVFTHHLQKLSTFFKHSEVKFAPQLLQFVIEECIDFNFLSRSTKGFLSDLLSCFLSSGTAVLPLIQLQQVRWQWIGKVAWTVQKHFIVTVNLKITIVVYNIFLELHHSIISFYTSVTSPPRACGLPRTFHHLLNSSTFCRVVL